MARFIRLCPFQPGQAVAYLNGDGSAPLKRPRTLIYGVVIRANPNTGWVTMQEPSGTLRRAQTWRFGYRGFCGVCQAPAVMGARGLTCPKCHSPAPLPPPDAWLNKAFGPQHSIYARIIARMAAGAPWEDAHTMTFDAERGSREECERAAKEATGRASLYIPGVPDTVYHQLDRLANEGRVEEYVALFVRLAEEPELFTAMFSLLRAEKAAGAERVRDLCLNWLERMDEQGKFPSPPLMPADDRTPDPSHAPAPRWLRGLGL